MLDTAAATLDASALLDPPAQLHRPLSERDEFGPISGRLGLFTTPITSRGLAEREDLGHALCAWANAEDLL
jgi:hypothetical protein